MLPIAILAGGIATRMRPLTEAIPKALLPVAGRPFLYHQLRLLRDAGFREVVLCVGHLGDNIREALRKHPEPGLEVKFSFDGPTLLGTGGAIKAALPLLGDAFFVVYGDSYLPCDYDLVQKAFLANGKAGLMTVFRNEGRWDSSNVEFDGSRIVAYDKRHQTTRMRYIDYGLGVFQSRAFEDVPADKQTDLAAIYQALLQTGELAALEIAQRFYEVGSFAGLQELSAHLAAREPNGPP